MSFFAEQNDDRPFVYISVLGVKFNCLLDTGANMSIAGEQGTKKLLSLGLKIDKSYSSSIKTADKTSHLISGIFSLPIEFKINIKSSQYSPFLAYQQKLSSV